MVTKITVDFPKPMSLHRSKPEGVYGIQTFEDYLQVSEIAERYRKIGLLISHFKNYPNSEVAKTIRGYFGDMGITVRKRTKKYRVYSFWLCYIHEED